MSSDQKADVTMYRERAYKQDQYLRTLEKLRRWPFSRVTIELQTKDNYGWVAPEGFPGSGTAMGNGPDFVFPSDQTLLIDRIAVPPQSYNDGDELSIIVGDKYEFRSPIKLLMDSYPVGFEAAAYLYLDIQQQFAVLTDAALQGELPQGELDKLRELHESMWLSAQGLGNPVEIVIPPRQVFRIQTRRNSEISVYLIGYSTHDVG